MVLMKKLLIFVLFVVMFVPQPVVGQSLGEANATLGRAEEAVGEMDGAGLPTNRVEDLLGQANSTFEAQVSLNESGKKADFSVVVEKSEEIIDVKKDAFMANDQLEVLSERIAEMEGSYNISEVNSSYRAAVQEFEDERFERCLEKVDETYEKISEAEAASTRLRAVYEASRENIVSFVMRNWLFLIIGGAVAVFLGWMGKREWRYYRLKSEKEQLDIRKKVLQDLIEETQKKYFETGEIPESTYNIRTSKYGDMIRDINRRIPLLEEERQKCGSWFQG